MRHQQCAVILSDTIVAVSSAPGRSERALVRVSGSGAARVMQSLLGQDSPGAPGRALMNARVRFGSKESELPALLAFMPAPHTYTGEDTLELQVPGNQHLVERVVAACITAGARRAEPGEFSARAYLAGRLTLTQAEGVAATIAARTQEQLTAAGALLAGRTGAAYHAFANECATLLALVEAGIDFTDQEDVVAISPTALTQRLHALLDGIASHLGGARGRETDGSLPRVALVGAPNAGKSTLFNALLGRPRAIASPTPGTTRDVLEEELDLSHDAPGAGRITLVDLPGLDAALAERAPVDALAIEAARATLDRADVLLWCDASGAFDGREIRRVAPAFLADADRPVVRVRTFADRAWRSAGVPNNADLREHEVDHPPEVRLVCALDGWNLSALRRTIANAARSANAGAIAALLPRHRHALRVAREQLEIARGLTLDDASTVRFASPELVADALRAALDALGELVGKLSPDEVLGRVFATFCVGK